MINARTFAILISVIALSIVACRAQTTGEAPVKPVRLAVDDRTDYVNVMGDAMPELPDFPALAKKPGKLRGYVKDVLGQPIAGARLGLKSARIYDAYLAAAAESDANGYYEINIPTGGARFDYAGFTIKTSRGMAALGLHPADGALSESYPAAAGGVENFVMLPYGIADRAGASSQAGYRANYYGGAFKLIYYISSGSGMGGTEYMLASGSEIVVALTPLSVLADGNRFARGFEIRKTIEDSSIGELNVVNLPIGRYRIAVAQANGKPLKMRQKAPTDSVFGMRPAETESGSAEIVFNPLSDDARTAAPSRGNWTDLEIVVERP